MALGTGLGVVWHNIPMGTAFGFIMGLLIGMIRERRDRVKTGDSGAAPGRTILPKDILMSGYVPEYMDV